MSEAVASSGAMPPLVPAWLSPGAEEPCKVPRDLHRVAERGRSPKNRLPRRSRRCGQRLLPLTYHAEHERSGHSWQMTVCEPMI